MRRDEPELAECNSESPNTGLEVNGVRSCDSFGLKLIK